MNAQTVVPIVSTQQDEGFYFRVRNNDHVVISQLLAEKRLKASGLVIDARYQQRHEDLCDAAQKAGLDLCLDTKAMEMAISGMWANGYSELPWGGQTVHQAPKFTESFHRKYIEKTAAFVCNGPYTMVLAPTHYISDEDSPWLEIDGNSTHWLRESLDAAGKMKVKIVYPLALPGKLLYQKRTRDHLIRVLELLPINAISLRIHPLGCDAGPQVMRSLIESCHTLRSLKLPLTLERSGFAGIAAYAMGAIDRVESGILLGDSFHVNSAKQTTGGFGQPPRVYVEALGRMLKTAIARELVASSHGKLRYACKDSECCPNGAHDMLRNSHRHTVLARQRQFAELEKIPPRLRAEHFLQKTLTPICDNLSLAADLHEPLRKDHRRMLSVKETLHLLCREGTREGIKPFVVSSNKPRPITNIVPLRPQGPIHP